MEKNISLFTVHSNCTHKSLQRFSMYFNNFYDILTHLNNNCMVEFITAEQKDLTSISNEVN